jgi:hypothetical protein
MAATAFAGSRRSTSRPTVTETHMPASTIHVEPNSTGRWIVRHEDAREPLSEHESATDAERAARALAEHEDASFVLLHDRYARIHELPV